MNVTFSRRWFRSNSRVVRPRPARLCLGADWARVRLESRVQPATFTVTNILDSGAGSFRDAINKANRSYGADVIDLTTQVGTISLLSQLPAVTDTTVIQGPGASKLTVQLDVSAPASRIVDLGGDVTLSGLTLTGGRPTDNGGAMFVFGHTTLNNCVVTGNTAGNVGGAVFVFDTSHLEINNSVISNNLSVGVGGAMFQAFDSTLTVRNSTISNNSSGVNSFGGGGGAMYFGFNGRLNMSNTTISGNVSTGAGGGVYIYGGGNAPAENSWVITQSTISNNSTSKDGGGVAFWSAAADNLVLDSCTITGNTAGTNGGGISTAAYGGPVTLRSTIVAGNTAGVGPDVATANPVAANNSAFSDTTGLVFTGGSANNVVDTFANLKLGPLQDNGGVLLPNGTTQQTHLPLAGSPLIDAGSNIAGRGLDQRGFSRTTGAGVADIGAAEFGTEALAANVATFKSYVSDGKPSYTVQVVYTDDTSVKLASIDTADLSITGPSTINVTAVSVDKGSDSPTLVATYTITPADTSWDPADIGQYTVATVAGQVSDTGIAVISAGSVGRFAAVPAPQVFTVTSNADAGPGTLRDAINAANASTGTHDTIAFAIGAGAVAITPTSPLPVISDEVTIDGWTQPGYVATSPPLVQIVGTSAGANADGLRVNAGNSVIRGLNVRSFSRTGITLEIGDGNTIQNCFVGTIQAGTGAAANGYRGINIRDSDNNLIGGATTQARNIVSGNNDHNIVVLASHDNVFQNNYVGTNVAGTGAVVSANSICGFFIGRGAAYNTLTGNVISGNFNHGVQLYDPGTSHNKVQGNKIGTNAAGTAAIKNGGRGTNSDSYGNGFDIAFGPTDNYIGTDGDGVNDSAEGNLISGNHDWGVVLYAGGTERNLVAGNKIGTNLAGTGPIANTRDGILIANASANNFIGTNGDGVSDNLEGNVISGNSGYGVQIVDGGTNGNRVSGNIIGLNATGTAKLQNNFEGLVIHFGASNNIIGTNGDGVGDAAERNIISGNASYGITIARLNTTNNVVAGNFVGTDITGTVALGNGRAGVWIFVGADHTRVGTNADGVSDDLERNLISGNGTVGSFPGVLIEDLSPDITKANTVAGNYIGTDITGLLSLPNTSHGVQIWDGTQDNVVGGIKAAERNVISGNTLSGVFIANSGSTDVTVNNVVIGNYVGVGVDGATAVPNGEYGLLVSAGTTGNRIGTNADGFDDAAEGNVISGNILDGVRIQSAATVATVVAGNRIGTDATGAKNVGNGGNGVMITDAAGNTVGGSAAGANTIAFNGIAGIAVTGASATGNSVRFNSIYSNGTIGIDLGNDGVTANDPLDADAGPNGLLNFPTLTAAKSGASTLVSGSYDGAASSSVTLEFFASPSGSPGGEGKRSLGTALVTTDGAGNVTFTDLPLTGASSAGEVITATALDGSNNSSEFSNAVTIPGGAPASKVSTVVVNGGAVQRSTVTTLKVTFDQILTFPATPADAFQLKRQSDSAAVNLLAVVDNSGAGSVVTITFTGGAVDAISLQDGRYTLTIDASKVSNANGNLDGDGNGSAGGNYVLVGDPTAAPKLYRLFGDADADNDVDTSDFAALRAVYGGAGPTFDFDNDGDVDTSDVGAFRARFGASV